MSKSARLKKERSMDWIYNEIELLKKHGLKGWLMIIIKRQSLWYSVVVGTLILLSLSMLSKMIGIDMFQMAGHGLLTLAIWLYPAIIISVVAAIVTVIDYYLDPHKEFITRDIFVATLLAAILGVLSGIWLVDTWVIQATTWTPFYEWVNLGMIPVETVSGGWYVLYIIQSITAVIIWTGHKDEWSFM
jgi:hypothetical protein